MTFDIQRFYRSKAVAFIFLCYAGAALLGMSLVFLSHGNYSVIVFVAILFLAGPPVAAYSTKNRFLRPIRLEVTESYLSITEEDREELMIRWGTVAGYQVEPTKAFFNMGYVLKISLHDGSKTRVILIERVFLDDTISEESALCQLCRSVRKFNRSAEQPVILQPDLLASRRGTVLATVSGILVLIAASLFLLEHGRANGKNVSGLTVIVVILAAGLAGRKKQSDKIYRQLQELHVQ